MASCTLVILVCTPLWTVELHSPCMHTCTCDTYIHTDPLPHRPCFLAIPPEPLLCVHSCKHGFLWGWVCLFISTSSPPLFWFVKDVYQTPPSPQEFALGPTCLVVKGRGEGNRLEFPSSIVFWLLFRFSANIYRRERTQNRKVVVYRRAPTPFPRVQALANTKHFCSCFSLVAYCH